jgi:hypothetical protein
VKKSRYFLWILLIACNISCNKEDEGLNNEQILADFEYAWHVADTTYPYMEFKRINWDSIYDVYHARALESNIAQHLVLIRDLLAELKDGHVFYHDYDGNMIFAYVPRRIKKDENTVSLEVIRSYFEVETKLSNSGKIEYEILPDYIGYAFLSDFSEEYLKNDFPSVLDYLKNTDGIILDVRHKQGGSDRNIEAVVSRFMNAPIDRTDFYLLGEQIPLPQLEPQGPYTYDNPVVVLINGLTFSAGELFTEMMKQLPNVTAIGDTTGGGSCGANWNATGDYYLPSGTLIHIGTTDRRRYDGLPWEWIGIPPDIRIVQSAQDIQSGRDLQLEYAIDLLK